MKSEIKIPAMGESITEATIGTIMKQSGSKVSQDEEILEIETDKVNQVLYAPKSGILTLSVQPQQAVKIGEVIGSIETVEEGIDEKSAAKPSENETLVKVKEAEVKQENSSIPDRSNSTAPIRYGKEQAIQDLKSPPKELQKEPELTSILPSKEKREVRRPLSKIRKVIASRLVEAQQNSAMLTTFNEVDMSYVMEMREKYKDTFQKKWNVKLGFMSFFVKAAVNALQQFPDVNSYIEGDEIVQRQYYDIGIAVGSERGLVVPVVRNCDQLSFAGIESVIEKYAKQVRSGGLSADQLMGGGFTITNGGFYGSLLSTPIINPPQCAILGLHKIEKRAVVIEDQIVIRPMMYLALSYDHRLIDGKEAVSFLLQIKNMIEDPTRLLIEV